MKKLFSLFSVIMMAVFFLQISTLSVSAEEPKTYYLKYLASEGEWYFQEGSAWDNEGYRRELYTLVTSVLKDGDLVVVDSSEGNAKTLELDFNLSNLTIMGDSYGIINVKSVKDFYALEHSSSIINGNVTNAWLYNYSLTNFNNDVSYLEIYYTNTDWNEPPVTFAVGGKLGHLFVHREGRTNYNLYDFTTPAYLKDGILQVAEEHYSTTPPATTQPPAATTPTAPSTSDEYDEVPKTGESLAFMWAFALAGLCFAGSYSLKKRS
ncbi:MAG: hypothetical protein IKK59_06415 [Lachnospiraceae bacterium]|nr:hypothetical protein [Lachnospiraceae bacterium]